MGSRFAPAMQQAIAEARTAAGHGDVPIGAIILDQGGEVLAVGCNERELLGDPTAHAEVVAIRRAAEKLGEWRLTGCTLVVTLEPCTMCAGAIVASRIEHLVFGAFDPRAGAVSSLFDVVRDPRLNHRPRVTAGVLEGECGVLLDDFFTERRPSKVVE